MLDIIYFVILREIFLRIIIKQDIMNFKFSLKRILNFVNKDRICQKHCLKFVYGFKYKLRFSNDYFKTHENLIISFDKSKFSKFLQEGFYFDVTLIYVRPSDDRLIVYFPRPSVNFHFIGYIEKDLQESIDSLFGQHDYFEFGNLMKSKGFFPTNLTFYKNFEDQLKNGNSPFDFIRYSRERYIVGINLSENFINNCISNIKY